MFSEWSSLITGFKEGVGFAHQKCRQCLCDFNAMNSNVFEDQFVLRDKKTHYVHCSQLPGCSATTGVNRKAAVLDICNFDIFDSVPQDVMHVLLEGCLPYTLKQMISLYIARGNITLDQINESISHFEYSYLDSSCKPSLISPNHLQDNGSLRQSASQMWALGRLLPFFVQGCIDFQEPPWQCFSLLLQITSTAMSQCISREEACGLKLVIAHYLNLFKSCYSDKNIIPKQHYLIHLPEIILKMGPVVRFWAMRFEAKHSFFKDLAHVANFKNAAKYMAYRHQRHLCMELLDQGKNSFFLQDKLESGPQRDIDASTLSLIGNDFAVPSSIVTNVKDCSWLRMNGSVFKRGCFVLVNAICGLPVFGKTDHILAENGQFYLCVQIFETIGVDEEMNCYLLRTLPTERRLVQHTKLAYHEALAAYQM